MGHGLEETVKRGRWLIVQKGTKSRQEAEGVVLLQRKQGSMSVTWSEMSRDQSQAWHLPQVLPGQLHFPRPWGDWEGS